MPPVSRPPWSSERVRLDLLGGRRRDADAERPPTLRPRRGAERERRVVRRERSADRADRQPQDGRALDELLTIHPALCELVDQVVLERACMVEAVLVEPPHVVAVHATPLLLR